jgi:catechol-2,3-dioxygenase
MTQMVFNHLHFASDKVVATRKFYEAYFGFRFHSNIRTTTVLVNESHFFLAIDPVEGELPPSENRLHFGFCLTDADSVEHLYRQMESNRVPFAQQYEQISENAVSFYCYDPAGNCVEVGWYRTLV